MNKQKDPLDTIRVHVDVDPDLHNRMSRVLPWGIKGQVLRMILMRVVVGLELDPRLLGAFTSGHFKFVYDPPDSEVSPGNHTSTDSE